MKLLSMITVVETLAHASILLLRTGSTTTCRYFTQKKKAQKLIERIVKLRAALHAPFNSTLESLPSPLLPAASQQYPEARGTQRRKGTILILTQATAETNRRAGESRA